MDDNNMDNQASAEHDKKPRTTKRIVYYDDRAYSAPLKPNEDPYTAPLKPNEDPNIAANDLYDVSGPAPDASIGVVQPGAAASSEGLIDLDKSPALSDIETEEVDSPPGGHFGVCEEPTVKRAPNMQSSKGSEEFDSLGNIDQSRQKECYHMPLAQQYSDESSDEEVRDINSQNNTRVILVLF